MKNNKTRYYSIFCQEIKDPDKCLCHNSRTINDTIVNESLAHKILKRSYNKEFKIHLIHEWVDSEKYFNWVDEVQKTGGVQHVFKKLGVY